MTGRRYSDAVTPLRLYSFPGMDNRTIFAFVFAPFIVPLVVVGHAVVSGTIFIPDPPDSSLRYTVLPYALLFVMSMLVAYGMEILMGLGV